MKRSIPHFLSLTITGIFLLLCLSVSAQVFTVTNTEVTINGHAHANDFIVPEVNGPAVFDEDSCVFAPQPLIAGFYGNDHAYLCNRKAREKKFTLPQSVTSAQVFSYGRVNGDNSGSIQIQCHHEARSFTNSLEGYHAHSTNNLIFTVTVTVTGLPGGTPVTVYADYSSFGAGLTEHEGANEDPVISLNLLTADGTEVLQGTHSFANPPGLSGWNERIHEPVAVTVTAGNPFDIEFRSNLSTWIDMPGKPYGFGATVDQAVASFIGTVNLNLVSPTYPTNGNTIGNGQVEFSLDIGSDAELSDPQTDGDEVFDPGDAYLMGGIPMPVGGLNGIKDDGFAFGIDPFPTPPDPTYLTSAPVMSGMMLSNVIHQYFDLDGHDNLATDLSSIDFLTGQPSIAIFNDPCVFFPEFVFISFDDDSLPTYLDPAGAVAVNSTSPFSFNTYGQTANQDEIIELNFAPIYPTALMATLNLYDEGMIHTNMLPNPDFGEPEDDDVDALDMNWGESQCPAWYFSPDHEATAIDPVVGGTLDPGGVYQVMGSGIIAKVVDPVAHLGLPLGVDVDAFEFVWLWDTLEMHNAFAMLFSTDDDDPLTVIDESGAKDPRHIYASFLNGTHFQFTNNPFDEDIDAIAVWETSLNGTPGPDPVGINDIQDNLHFNVYPNPFKDEVNVGFALDQGSKLTLDVVDATGRVIQNLAVGEYAKGVHNLNWNIEHLASGYYVIRIQTDDFIATKKLLKSK